MNQQERCLWLIKALLKDMPQYADTPIPTLPDHRWRLLRSLMNVRMLSDRVMAKESITSGKPMARAR